MKIYDYTGLIHLHASLSFDSHEPMNQIITSTQKNGIDFIMLTEHDHLKARAPDGFGFIAHPEHEGAAMFHVKHYEWKNCKVSDYSGIGPMIAWLIGKTT